MSHLITEEFKNLIKEYVDVDDKIKGVSAAMKKIKGEKEVLSQKILKYMKTKGIGQLNLPDGSKLEFKQTKIRAVLTKKDIFQNLKAYFNNDEKADKLIDYINDPNNREFVERETLSRRKGKGGDN